MNQPSTEYKADGVVLVVGGARSGKSAFAEQLVASPGEVVYVATAEILDSEMRQRVDLHRVRRGPSWRTIEEPLAITELLTNFEPALPVLVDCLTIWLSNLLYHQRDARSEIDRLIQCAAKSTRTVVFVTNEVGCGIVPDNQLARAFRDQAGLMNQQMAAIADAVYLVTAGLPLQLK